MEYVKAADMHCDTISMIQYRRGRGERIGLRENDMYIDLGKLKRGGYVLQTFAIFTDLEEKDPLETALEQADIFYREMEASQDLIRPVTRMAQVDRNMDDGKLSALLSLEGGDACRGNLSVLRDFYRLGVRMVTLTWNNENELAYPQTPRCRKKRSGIGKAHSVIRDALQRGFSADSGGRSAGSGDSSVSLGSLSAGPESAAAGQRKKGLKEAGFAFLEEMERLGMIIDVSHLSDDGFYDVLEHTSRPFVASHSNARALAAHPRNLTDSMLKSLADRGGVAGVNFYNRFLSVPCGRRSGLPAAGDFAGQDTYPETTTNEAIICQIRHMTDIAGMDSVGLGTDFDGFECPMEMENCSMLQKLAEDMERAGFTNGEIEGIFYKNVVRVYREILDGGTAD